MTTKFLFRRISSQVSVGISFLEDYFYENPKMDLSELRCILILISYHFELLLKSFYIKINQFNNKADADKRLHELGHKIDKIGNKIGGKELLKIGIKNISQKSSVYTVETTNRKIKIENFTDIRYDFIMGKRRKVSTKKYQRTIEGVKEISKIFSKIKEYKTST